MLGNPRLHRFVIELWMSVPDAVGHDSARAVEEARSLEELLFRAHRPRTDDLFAVERIRKGSERIWHHQRFYQRNHLVSPLESW